MPKSKKLIVFAAVIAILLLAVGSFFVFSNSSAQLRKKAIETVEHVLPGCEYIETMESESGDVYVFINPEGVEFWVWYSNDTEIGAFKKQLLSNYSFAVINYYADTVKNMSYPGVRAETNNTVEVILYVDGEQYIENALNLCVDLQNIFKLNIAENSSDQFSTPTVSFDFHIKGTSGEYVSLNTNIAIATAEKDWNNYDALYDWLITEYNNQSK